MDKEQEPVNENIVYTNISQSNPANWVELKENVKWKYQRSPDATAFEILTIINNNNKKMVFELDANSSFEYEIVSFGTLKVKGKVRSHSPFPS